MFVRPPLGLAMVALLSASAAAQDISASLAPPQGATLIGRYAAKGVQIYVCALKGSEKQWEFKAPQAQLFDAQGKVFAQHYAGPTWESMDGSKTVGRVVASEPAPKTGAIAWLLLSTQSLGEGVLAGARFVQRINTSGGTGPTGVCPVIGIEERSDYTADYLIYR
jgi:hypothetical protein